VTALDAAGRAVFESGRVSACGLIDGNDSDADGTAFEPHYQELTRGDQVQIYESVMGPPAGTPTTGLLQATQYLKDNRLLPRGFDKRTAEADIAVHGAAADDADFMGGGDHLRYMVDVGTARGPFKIEAELLYQPIGFRWAQNLKSYAKASEPRRFTEYYDAMADGATAVLARASR
jgi:hypothetical protein